MNTTDLNQQVNGTSNCIIDLCQPYTTYPYTWTYTCPPSGPSLSIEKLPGGFIVSFNGRREILASFEALTGYLQRWGGEKP